MVLWFKISNKQSSMRMTFFQNNWIQNFIHITTTWSDNFFTRQQVVARKIFVHQLINQTFHEVNKLIRKKNKTETLNKKFSFPLLQFHFPHQWKKVLVDTKFCNKFYNMALISFMNSWHLSFIRLSLTPVFHISHNILCNSVILF